MIQDILGFFWQFWPFFTLLPIHTGLVPKKKSRVVDYHFTMNTFKLRLTHKDEWAYSICWKFSRTKRRFWADGHSYKVVSWGFGRAICAQKPPLPLTWNSNPPTQPEFRRVKSHVIKFDHTVVEISMWTLKRSLLCVGQRFFGEFFSHVNFIPKGF